MSIKSRPQRMTVGAHVRIEPGMSARLDQLTQGRPRELSRVIRLALTYGIAVVEEQRKTLESSRTRG